MTVHKTMKKIPYGLTDFERFRREDYYYVDKTRFIEEVERYYRDAVEQVTGYAQDHPMLIKARANDWTLHRIVCVVRGWTLERLEELT